MGLGLLGRGVGDVKFLAEQGAELIVTDLKSELDLKESVDALRGFSNIAYVLGRHRLEDFRDRDFIIKAAGVPLDSPFIAEAKRHNIPVEMSSAVFASFTEATVIGVTGTRGKSTVTHLLFDILQKAPRQDSGHQETKVFLGGNVKGVSTLAFLSETKKGDFAVLELDSWQLQGFGEQRISPHLSIFTTFLDDHLNYYHGDAKLYLADKANIFKYQSDHDFLIVGKQAEMLIKEHYADEVRSKIIIADDETVPESWRLAMPGIHNRYNAGLAVAAADILGISRDITKAAVENFPGLPGRLELVREYQGIKIYNDTNATTPDATIAGLRALGNESKRVVLIFGGADKNLEMSKLFENIPEYAKAVVLLPGTGSERIKSGFVNLMVPKKAQVKTLEEAVAKALEFAEAGDSILFSPAFASFGIFTNEFDRGDQFNGIVKKLN